jgi:hypothetical protein
MNDVDIPERSDPDFTVAGTALLEWLGHEAHEATLKAAEQAIAVPTESFMVAVFHEPTLPAGKFGEQQRRALKVWVKKAHPDLPGRLRLNVRTQLEPTTGQDVRVVVVTYDPKPRVSKVTEKLDEIHGLGGDAA